MFSSIVVPLDGSDTSRHAIPWAIAVGTTPGAVVHLVHAHVSRYGMGAVDELTVAPSVDAATRAAVEMAFDQLAHRLTIGTGIAFRAAATDGEAADAIVGLARQYAANLIVMTTHGRSGLARALLGSVADLVVRRAGLPVLLVRPSRDPVEEREPPSVSDVLVLLDGTTEGESILEPSVSLARVTGAACTLLRVMVPELALRGVVPAGALVDPAGMDADVQDARAYLTGRTEVFRQSGIPVDVQVAVHADVGQAVVDYCSTHPVSLVAMATHGRSGLKRGVLGSVADTLLRRLHLPLMILTRDAPLP